MNMHKSGRASGRLVRGGWLGVLALVGLVGAGGLGVPALAEIGVVVLKGSGQRVCGKIEQTAGGVDVVLAGQVTSIKREEIDRILKPAEALAELEEKTRDVKPTDIAGLNNLAKFALENGLPEQAIRYAKMIQQVEPNNRLAGIWISSAEDLQRKLRITAMPVEPPAAPGGAGAGGSAPVAPVAPAGGGDAGEGGEQPAAPVKVIVGQPLPLTEAQVQLLRLKEFKPSDGARARVSIKPNTSREFAEQMAGKPGYETDRERQAFQRLKDPDKFARMLDAFRDELNPVDFSPGIEIRTDPPQIDFFVRRVYPVILQNCATAVCHGGDSGPGIAWIRADRPRPEQYLANMLALEEGTFGPRNDPLVDRERPAASLLLDFLLPPDVAQRPHPKVQGFPVKVLTDSSVEYRDVDEWIRQLKPNANYGIKLERKPVAGGR